MTVSAPKKVPDRSQGKVRTGKIERRGEGALRYLQTSQATMQVLDNTFGKRSYAHADFTKPHRFRTGNISTHPATVVQSSWRGRTAPLSKLAVHFSEE